MFESDVALILYLLIAAVMGFLNGWFFNRLLLDGDAEPEATGQATVRHALPGVSAELMGAGEPSSATVQEQGLGNVASFDAVFGALEPQEDVADEALSEEERRVRTAQMRAVEAKARESEAQLARRNTELRNLRARVEVLDPLVSQVRQRDEWLQDQGNKHRTALAEKDVEIERRDGRITDLQGALERLQEQVQAGQALEPIARRLEVEAYRPQTVDPRLGAEIAACDAELSRLRSEMRSEMRTPRDEVAERHA